MSESVALIFGPVVEPVTLNDARLQLGFGPIDDSTREASQIVNDKVRRFIITARQDAENYLQRALITQTWILRRDSFPGHNLRYDWNGYPEIVLPKPPFQSVQRFTYIDVAGFPRHLFQDTTFGTNPFNPEYSYQLERGSETQPGRLLPAFAQPWPPTRMVPANVIVQFRCGYGGPITVSIEAGSLALTVTGGSKLGPAGRTTAFDRDDAPLLPGETGLPIKIPGAGPNADPLETFIASVDPETGAATLADAASTTVAGATAWAGEPVPSVIIDAIKMLVQFYYDHGGCEDVPLPRVVESLLLPYRNLVA